MRFHAAIALALMTFGWAQDPPNELERARALLQQQKPQEALPILEAWTKAHPEDVKGWFLHAHAHHGAGAFEQALVSLEHVLELQPTHQHGLYNRACALARLGRVDDAFAALERARKAGFDQPWQIASDADLNALRGDARLTAFLPKAVPSEELFTEQPRILHTLEGEHFGDVFGWEGRNLGDCDGDAVADFVLSAPWKARGGANAGRVYVYSGKRGALLFQKDGEPGDFLGAGIEAAGDVNGDGHADVLVGAPRWGQGPGRALVYSGQDGSLLLELHGKEGGDARFGNKGMGVGDIDGDGHADLLIGSPNGRGTGCAYLISGKTGDTLAVLEGERADDQFGSCVAGTPFGASTTFLVGAPNAGEGRRGRTYAYRYVREARRVERLFALEGDERGVNFGRMFLSILGDVDADGTADLYVSDWEHQGHGPSSGKVYVHSGATGKLLFALEGTHPREGFGIGPATAGDVNGDGIADLLIGAWQNPEGAPAGGKSTLYSGKDRSVLRTFTCTAPGDTFGFDAVGLGDIDGDGAIDFLVTAAYSACRGPRTGRAFVIAGQ